MCSATSKGEARQLDNVASTFQSWVGRISSVLSIVAAVLGLGVWIFSSFIQTQRSDVISKELTIRNDQVIKFIAEYQSKFNDVISRISALEQHISSISNIPKEDTLYIEMQKVSTSVSDLNSRESKIESIILESPAKALEMPLLRRDLDNVKEAQQAAVVSLKESVDRVYDLNKWLLGAMAVSVVTLAAGNLLKPKETKP